MFPIQMETFPNRLETNVDLIMLCIKNRLLVKLCTSFSSVLQNTTRVNWTCRRDDVAGKIWPVNVSFKNRQYWA